MARLLGIAAIIVVLVISILVIRSYADVDFKAWDAILKSLLIKSEHNDDPLLVFALAFIPALLTISFPFIIQIIARLNELYDSTHVVEQFYKERLHRLFIWCLPITVFCTFTSISLFKIFLYISLLSTAVLLVIFFLYSHLLMKYNNGRRLFHLYSKRINLEYRIKLNLSYEEIQTLKKDVLNTWQPIIDLYVYSGTVKDKTLRDDIFDFIYHAHRLIQVKENSKNSYPEFPIEYYNSSFEIISKYVQNPSKYSFLNTSSFVGDLYFPVSKFREKSQFFHRESFLTIWKNLLLLIDNNLKNDVIRYWSGAHQYIDLNLKEPRAKFDKEHNELKISFEERTVARNDRKMYLQFHTVFCAYLYYLQDFDFLRKLWNYTSSLPPRYPLILSRVEDIFNFYSEFNFYNIFNNDKILFRYQFGDLDLEVAGNNNDVLYQVRQYCGVLFLRIWFKRDSQDYKGIPIANIPENQYEKKGQVQKIHEFGRQVLRLLENNELLNGLKWNVFSGDHPKLVKEYFDIWKSKIISTYNTKLASLKLSEELVSQFDNKMIKEIGKVFNDFKRISGEHVSKQQRDIFSKTFEVTRGELVKLNKENFVTNSTLSVSDIDSGLANKIVAEYRDHFANKFELNCNVKFEITYGLLFRAINRLKLNKRTHVLVAFNMKHHIIGSIGKIDVQSSDGNEDYFYKGIPIYSFKSNNVFPYGCFYVLKSEHLPMITHKNPKRLKLDKASRDRWNDMIRLDKDGSLFLFRNKIEDLNDVKIERSSSTDGYDRHYLTVDVDFLAYCWFNKKVEMVEISQTIPYSDNKAKNRLSDLKPFSNLFPSSKKRPKAKKIIKPLKRNSK